MGVCAIKYVSNINKLSYFIKGAFTFVFWTWNIGYEWEHECSAELIWFDKNVKQVTNQRLRITCR